MLAVSILAIMFTLAFGSLNYIIRTKKNLDDRRDSTGIANSILLRLCREFQRIDRTKLVAKAGSGPGVSPYLIGEKKSLSSGESGDGITFSANEGGQYVPGARRNSGVVTISYRVEEDPDVPRSDEPTYVLVRDETPNILPVEEAQKRLLTFPVAHGILSFELRYYDVQDNKWSDEWTKPGDIPGLVRLALSMKTPAGRVEHFVTVVPIMSSKAV